MTQTDPHQILAEVNAEPRTVRLRDQEYELRPLTVRQMCELSKIIRDSRSDAYIDMLKRARAGGLNIGPQERAQTIATIVTKPFSFPEVVDFLQTPDGAAWSLSRTLHRDGKAIGDAAVLDLTFPEMLETVLALADLTGFGSREEVVEEEGATTDPPIDPSSVKTFGSP